MHSSLPPSQPSNRLRDLPIRPRVHQYSQIKFALFILGLDLADVRGDGGEDLFGVGEAGVDEEAHLGAADWETGLFLQNANNIQCLIIEGR